MDIKHFISTICLMTSLAVAQAQPSDTLDRYDVIPADFQEVFLDYIEESDTRIITTEHGQFLGHTKDGMLYGYGVYYDNNGNQWIGQYRKGECIFGILIDSLSATIGSKTHYVLYDLPSCRIKFVRQSGNDRIIPEKETEAYHFEALNYANGDRYVGETLEGKKHGYGIYYWSNGNFWFGEFHNNIRHGYGALFTSQGNIFPGKWIGDEKVRR